jgi:hypothetical protein
MYSELKSIIDKTTKLPTIVNPESNFVVVTYWWGRGNKNNNTARPCVAYYESIINPITNLALETINTARLNKDIDIKETLQNLHVLVPNLAKYKNHILGKSKVYMDMVSSYCNIELNSANRDANTLICLEKYKKSGKTPLDYEYKPVERIAFILDYCIKEFLKLNKDSIYELFETKDSINRLKTRYMEQLKTMSEKQKVILKNIIKANSDKKKELLSNIKQTIKKQITSSIEEYNGKSILDILNYEMRYLNPLSFEDMIIKWETECRSNNCNFLAVEYPEFARPGGYQLAINAKPLFIKKALELCDERSVLYIDGDMFIRKYPSLFDLKDVDFMARGWWIDPRSSYKMEESITYDPYTFETSGGTMFFSQSRESKILIESWIEESEKPYQQGKADDRLLSLVFNVKAFLLNMKIIQLPIEYLWLTLDYDDRMMDLVYDYDYPKMRESIFIEHPECLTTEDTATGAGASSDRTPKYYDFLDDNLVPASEEMHEYLMFPNKQMTSAFRNYFDYMDGITYLDDGNPLLIERNLIDQENPSSNEAPIYITSYDDKLGKKKHGEDKDYTIQQMSDLNYKLASSMNIETMRNISDKGEFIEIIPDTDMNDAKLLRLILRLLKDNKNVLFNPKTSESDIYYDILVSKMNTTYENMDIVFTPVINSYYFSDFFKPTIDLSKPVLFRPGNRILLDFLSMFLSLDSFSTRLSSGSYEFVSRCRVGYVIKPKEPKLTGGNRLMDSESDDYDPLIEYINSYNSGLEDIYRINKQQGGFKKNKNKSNRKTKKNKYNNKKSTFKNVKKHKKTPFRKTKKHKTIKKSNLKRKTKKIF